MAEQRELKFKISPAQMKVLEEMGQGAVIGELSDKINGRYELFTSEPESFIIRSLNKNTVFALLSLGVIKRDNSISEQMAPFSRDYWYRLV